MRIVSTALLIAGLVTTAACTADAPTTPSEFVPTPSTQPTIAEIAVGNDDFSTLVAALQRAGLVDTFNGAQPYTVFAPTNAAFDAAAAALLGGDATGLDLVNGLDVQTLTSVLLYHVSRGTQDAQAILASDSILMLDRNTAAVSTTGGGAAIAGAQIVVTDIVASNGIVHVVNSVLLPPSLR